MRSFLVRNKQPIIKWSLLPDGIMFKGEIPDNWDLAIVPGPEYIILDVDKHNGKNGFDHIPSDIYNELEKSFNYVTKNGGRHYWLKYTGDVKLPNKTSKIFCDLRNKDGYVVFYPRDDIKNHEHKIQKTSSNLNKWLEETFYYVNKTK